MLKETTSESLYAGVYDPDGEKLKKGISFESACRIIKIRSAALLNTSKKIGMSVRCVKD